MYTSLLPPKQEGQNKPKAVKNAVVFLFIGALMFFLGFNMGERHQLESADISVAEPVPEPPYNADKNDNFTEHIVKEIAISNPVAEDYPQWVKDTIALGEEVMRERGYGEASVGAPKKKKKSGVMERACKRTTGTANLDKCEEKMKKAMEWVAEYAEMEENAVCKRNPTSSSCPEDFSTTCAATMSDWCSKPSEEWSWLYMTTDYANCRAAWTGQALSTSSAAAQTVALFASGGTFTVLKGIFKAGKGLKKGLKAMKTASKMAKLKFVLGMIRKPAVKAAKNLWKNLKSHLKEFILDDDNKQKAMEFATLAASEAAAEKEANEQLGEHIILFSLFVNSWWELHYLKPSIPQVFMNT